MGKDKKTNNTISPKKVDMSKLLQTIRGATKRVTKESTEDLRRGGGTELLSKGETIVAEEIDLAIPFLDEGYAYAPSWDDEKVIIIVAVSGATENGQLVVQQIWNSRIYTVDRKKCKLLGRKKLKKVQSIHGLSQFLSPVVPFQRMIAGTVFGGRVRVTRLNLLQKTATFDLLD